MQISFLAVDAGTTVAASLCISHWKNHIITQSSTWQSMRVLPLRYKAQYVLTRVLSSFTLVLCVAVLYTDTAVLSHLLVSSSSYVPLSAVVLYFLIVSLITDNYNPSLCFLHFIYLFIYFFALGDFQTYLRGKFNSDKEKKTR